MHQGELVQPLSMGCDDAPWSRQAMERQFHEQQESHTSRMLQPMGWDATALPPRGFSGDSWRKIKPRLNGLLSYESREWNKEPHSFEVSQKKAQSFCHFWLAEVDPLDLKFKRQKEGAKQTHSSKAFT